MKRLVFGVLVLVISNTGAFGGLIFDTTPTWNGTTSVGPFGVNFQSAGQTFVVDGAFPLLMEFSLFVEDQQPTQPPLSVTGFIMEWNGTMAVGPVLYESDIRLTTNNGGAGNAEELNFITGGILLEAGQQYVAFVDTGETPLQVGGSVGLVPDNPFAGGKFVRTSHVDFSEVTIFPWQQSNDSDAAFIATFTPIPEPSSLVLFTLGTVGLGFTQRRRRKRKMAA